MMALDIYRTMYCDGCGGALEETMRIENEYAYKATGPWLCWGCETIGKARGVYVEKHPNAQKPDRWMLEKKKR